MRLLDAGGFQVLQNHADEILLVAAPLFGTIDQLIVLIDGEHAVRRKAFDRERSGDSRLALVLIRFVVEIFVIGLGGYGGNRPLGLRPKEWEWGVPKLDSSNGL